MGFVMIYTTHQNMQEATKITSHLLKEKLIACANIFPMKSAYRWQGEIVSEDEVVSIVKTKTPNWESVKSEIERIHPYEVPCIIKISAEANRDYETWINSETL